MPEDLRKKHEPCMPCIECHRTGTVVYEDLKTKIKYQINCRVCYGYKCMSSENPLGLKGYAEIYYGDCNEHCGHSRDK